MFHTQLKKKPLIQISNVYTIDFSETNINCRMQTARIRILHPATTKPPRRHQWQSFNYINTRSIHI